MILNSDRLAAGEQHRLEWALQAVLVLSSRVTCQQYQAHNGNIFRLAGLGVFLYA